MSFDFHWIVSKYTYEYENGTGIFAPLKVRTNKIVQLTAIFQNRWKWNKSGPLAFQ